MCNQYQPDYVTPLSETLVETMKMHGYNQLQLARLCGVSPAYLNDIIRGRRRISVNMAIALEIALDVPAEFWLTRQMHHDLRQARDRYARLIPTWEA